ncbi:hypothetical protein K439DRAFT_1664602 [Ramaria rubella]|nr:hypothetical protein K439DRAFT_1664602 [Ramaria rubella]
MSMICQILRLQLATVDGQCIYQGMAPPIECDVYIVVLRKTSDFDVDDRFLAYVSAWVLVPAQTSIARSRAICVVIQVWSQVQYGGSLASDSCFHSHHTLVSQGILIELNSTLPQPYWRRVSYEFMQTEPKVGIGGSRISQPHGSELHFNPTLVTTCTKRCYSVSLTSFPSPSNAVLSVQCEPLSAGQDAHVSLVTLDASPFLAADMSVKPERDAPLHPTNNL